MMNTNLVNKVGSIGQDNLLAKIFPPAEMTGVIIRKGTTETIYPRGTVLARSSIDKKLVILGTTAAAASGDTPAETLTPAYILCDDVTVGTAADAPAVAYRTGNFNRGAVTVKDGYTMTADDEDALRKYGIVFTDMLPA